MKDHPERKILRKRNFDYRTPGPYFITFPTKERARWKGSHQVGELGILDKHGMHLNKAGEVVLTQWNGLPKHYPFVRLEVVAVLPGHVHGLLWMESPDGHFPKHPVTEIVRAWKTFSAREINRMRGTIYQPFWQRSFYDHIIYEERHLTNVRNYIINNAVRHYEERPSRVAG